MSAPLRCFAHDGFAYPLPEGHRFPLGKYALLRARVARDPRFDVRDARAATRAELLLAHTEDWLARVESGALQRDELRALGLPWSPELVERARRSVGATLEAASAALGGGEGDSHSVAVREVVVPLMTWYEHGVLFVDVEPYPYP